MASSTDDNAVAEQFIERLCRLFIFRGTSFRWGERKDFRANISLDGRLLKFILTGNLWGYFFNSIKINNKGEI